MTWSLATLGIGLLVAAALVPSASSLDTSGAGNVKILAVGTDGINCEDETTRHTNTDYDHHTTCLVHFDENGMPDCIGYTENWASHYNDPNNPPSTQHWEDCAQPV